jgi:hypothetical protein
MHHVFFLAAAFLGIACAAKVIFFIPNENDAALVSHVSLPSDFSLGTFAKENSQNKIYLG